MQHGLTKIYVHINELLIMLDFTRTCIMYGDIPPTHCKIRTTTASQCTACALLLVELASLGHWIIFSTGPISVIMATRNQFCSDGKD